MFPLWFALLGGSFVFLDVGPSFFTLYSPFLGALVYLWLAGFHCQYHLQNIIIIP
jgi:hypothetical protein